MSLNKRACCPRCTRITGTFTHNGRRIYQHHYQPGTSDPMQVCDASGWLVEDDELVVVPRKPRSDAGVARPSRTVQP